MKPLPADETVLAACEAAHGDIDRIAALFPVVREHRLRGGERPPGVDLVVAAAGRDDSGLPTTHYSDPIGEMVVNARPQQEHLDRKALLKVLKAVEELYRARVFLASCLPAVDANLTAEAKGKRLPGQLGTALAGVVPIGQRPRTTSDCTLCAEPADRVRGGWCDRCYHSWQGWRGRSLSHGVTPDRDVFARWRKAHLEAAQEPAAAQEVSA